MFMRFLEAMHKFGDHLQLEVRGITAERFFGDLRQFCVYIRNKDIEFMTEETIVEYLNFLKDLNLYKHNGIAQRAGELRKFFTFASRKGWIHFDPDLIPKIPIIDVQSRVATPEQYQKLLGIIPDTKWNHLRNKTIIMLLHDTGMRSGEVSSLDLRNVDTKAMKAVVKTEKIFKGNFTHREVFWTAQTNKILLKWLTARKRLTRTQGIECPEALFIGNIKGRFGKRLSSYAISLMLRIYSKKAKIPVCNPHSFRHKFGHDANNAHLNNSQISSLMGHRHLDASFKYTALRDHERERVYRERFRGK